MQISDINPFMRFAQLQPSIIEGETLRMSYDYRLFYAVSGKAILKLADEERIMTPGMILFMRPETPYSFLGKLKVIVLNFDLSRRHADQKKAMRPSPIGEFHSEWITENDPPEELSGTILQLKAFEMEPLLKKCIAHFQYPTSLSDAYTSAWIKEILCFILYKPEEIQSKTSEIIQKTMFFIQSNYEKPLQNADISSTMGYHSYYLNRIFKENTGMTLHQTLLKVRLQHAKELLRQTSLPIESIAKETGFSDCTQFCTTFRKSVGMAPGSYRTQKLKEKP